jgi:hypothetical protein
MNGHKKPVPDQNSPPHRVFSNRTVASSTPPTDFAENISAPFGLIGQQLQSKAGLGGKGQDSGVPAAVEFVTGVDARRSGRPGGSSSTQYYRE